MLLINMLCRYPQFRSIAVKKTFVLISVTLLSGIIFFFGTAMWLGAFSGSLFSTLIEKGISEADLQLVAEAIGSLLPGMVFNGGIVGVLVGLTIGILVITRNSSKAPEE